MDFSCWQNCQNLKTAPDSNQKGTGAALRLLIFTKKISKTAPEAASRLRQKIQQIARSASTVLFQKPKNAAFCFFI